MPKAFAKLEDDKSQEFFLNYIKYRVLYAFAEIVWKRTERHCKNIAMSPGNNDSAKNALLHSFKVFDDYPIIDVVSNDEQGYDIMNELIDNYEPRIDFGVLQYWSYRDIVGSIQSQGFKDEQLWKDVIDAPEPTKASIGELLDDNQTMRLY